LPSLNWPTRSSQRRAARWRRWTGRCVRRWVACDGLPQSRPGRAAPVWSCAGVRRSYVSFVVVDVCGSSRPTPSASTFSPCACGGARVGARSACGLGRWSLRCSHARGRGDEVRLPRRRHRDRPRVAGEPCSARGERGKYGPQSRRGVPARGAPARSRKMSAGEQPWRVASASSSAHGSVARRRRSWPWQQRSICSSERIGVSECRAAAWPPRRSRRRFRCSPRVRPAAHASS
jgi:hypothetical protein